MIKIINNIIKIVIRWKKSGKLNRKIMIKIAGNAEILPSKT
jgi:hypothetical protein